MIFKTLTELKTAIQSFLVTGKTTPGSIKRNDHVTLLDNIAETLLEPKYIYSTLSAKKTSSNWDNTVEGSTLEIASGDGHGLIYKRVSGAWVLVKSEGLHDYDSTPNTLDIQSELTGSFTYLYSVDNVISKISTSTVTELVDKKYITDSQITDLTNKYDSTNPAGYQTQAQVELLISNNTVEDVGSWD